MKPCTYSSTRRGKMKRDTEKEREKEKKLESWSKLQTADIGMTTMMATTKCPDLS